jgi:hypothetical protein
MVFSSTFAFLVHRFMVERVGGRLDACQHFIIRMAWASGEANYELIRHVNSTLSSLPCLDLSRSHGIWPVD